MYHRRLCSNQELGQASQVVGKSLQKTLTVEKISHLVLKRPSVSTQGLRSQGGPKNLIIIAFLDLVGIKLSSHVELS